MLGRGGRKKVFAFSVQAILASGVAWFVYENVVQNLGSLGNVQTHVDLDLMKVAGSAALIWMSYGALILAWRMVLHGWGENLGLRAAAYVWCLSNLGRYVPGKIWSIAGMALLAERQGVSAWAATSSAVAMQLLAMATGAALVLVFVPSGITPGAVLIAFVIAMLSVAALNSKRIVGLLGTLLGDRFELRPLPIHTIFFGLVITAAAWVAYGIAFWLLAAGMVPDAVPGIGMAIGTFAAGYIVGLIALFAPGGLVVREGIIVSLLSPSIGVGPALTISIGSRLLLTFTEVSVALVALILRPRQGVPG